METTQCPICGNPGIPDYKSEDVVCPHCGSDLKIYRVLAEASNKEAASVGRARKYKNLAVVLPVVVGLVVGLAFYLCYINAQESYQDELTVREANIAKLEEEINVLSNKLHTPVDETNAYIDYIVVRNDGPWSIVKKVFGDTSNWYEEYRQIAKDNGFWDDNKGSWQIIHPGQILRIKKVK